MVLHRNWSRTLEAIEVCFARVWTDPGFGFGDERDKGVGSRHIQFREIISLYLFSMYSIMFDQKIVDIITQTKDKKKKPKSLDKIFKGAKGKAPKGTHTMSDGTIMSGTKHSKSSKVLKKGKGKRSKY